MHSVWRVHCSFHLDVSMKDVAAMQEVDCRANLQEPKVYLMLIKWSPSLPLSANEMQQV